MKDLASPFAGVQGPMREEKTRKRKAGKRTSMCISYKVQGVGGREEMLRGELA